MIVDSKGNMFEDRRKSRSERRKASDDVDGGRRREDRRKTPSGERKAGRRK